MCALLYCANLLQMLFLFVDETTSYCACAILCKSAASCEKFQWFPMFLMFQPELQIAKIHELPAWQQRITLST